MRCNRRVVLSPSRRAWRPFITGRRIQISTKPGDVLEISPPEPFQGKTTPGISAIDPTDYGLTKQLLDVRFEITGSPSSLLSVTLSASQNLYTRRGTLVAVSGKAENVSPQRKIMRERITDIFEALSTLSILEPFRRAFLRIPFLYQRISATTPITALISTGSSNNSMTVVHMDGTTDWMLAGRALVAWSGQTLSVSPVMNARMVGIP